MAKQLKFKDDFIYNPVPYATEGKLKLYKQKDEKRAGNPLLDHYSVDTLICTIVGLNRLSKVFGVHSSGMITLFVVYQYYKLHGYGCGVWDVLKKSGYSGNSHCTLIQVRLGLFAKKGLVDVMGTGINNRKLYAPTRRTISLIDDFIK